MDEDRSIEKELREFQAELDPILRNVVLGELPDSYDISVPEDSGIRELRGTCKLLIDGFFEQWTELLAMQEKLLERNKEYLEVISRLETFTYTASHELRSQVVNLVMLSDLKERNLDSAINDRIDVDFRKSISRLSVQLDELIANVSGSSAPIVKRPLDLKQVLEEVCKELGYKDVSNIDLSNDSSGTVIINDWYQFKSLFKILLENSNGRIKESEKIRISSYTVSAERNEWGINYIHPCLEKGVSCFDDVVIGKIQLICEKLNIESRMVESEEGNYYLITGKNE